MNIKNYLKELVEDGVDFYDMPYELEVENWPIVIYDGEEESLDCENFEWISITDDEVVIACGGDWQEPLTLTIKVVDDKLTVVSTEEGFADGLSEDEFYEVLGIEKEEE